MRKNPTAATTGTRVELYVRSLSPDDGRGPQFAVLSELRSLEDAGWIDDLCVTVWGRRIGLSTTAARTDDGEAILDAIAAFRSWAAANDRSLEPLLATREVTSEITGESHTSLVLPTMMLAEYRDGELHHVVPYAEDGSVTTVADRIEVLTAHDGEYTDRDVPLVTR